MPRSKPHQVERVLLDVYCLRNAVDKKTVLENLDLVLLALDELIDGGLILETEPAVIASRVAMRGSDSDVPLSEQHIALCSLLGPFDCAEIWAPNSPTPASTTTSDATFRKLLKEARLSST
eukprot:jgi/Mesvir1/1976/Mv16603-RA.1